MSVGGVCNIIMLTGLIRLIVLTRIVLCKTYVDRFDSAHPGIVFTRTASNVEEQPFNLLWPGKGQLPAVACAAIPSPGLDLAWQQYLYNSIRPFVKPALQDILCPRPVSDQPADVPADVPVVTDQPAARGASGRGDARGRGARVVKNCLKRRLQQILPSTKIHKQQQA